MIYCAGEFGRTPLINGHAGRDHWANCFTVLLGGGGLKPGQVVGASEARGELLVFLNNDTVPHPGWLDALVETVHRHGNVGAVGSKLLSPNGKVQHAGVVFSPSGAPYNLYRHEPADAPHVNVARPMPGVPGACMLVPRRTFVRVGGFDPRFLNGFEDVDLCLRLRAHGLACHYCPTSVLTHVEGATERPYDKTIDNGLLLSMKWAGRPLGYDAYRLVHGEADRLPGLFVDRYADVAVVQTACAAMDAREKFAS